MPLIPGAKLEGYEVLGLLGAGGMGEVYRARDPVLKRDVAIKVLPSFVSQNPDRLRRFEREAQAAAALNHPNILAVFQFGVFEGAPYLVSELLVGETLRQQLERGPLPVRKAIDVGMQLAHGMSAAHEKGIVHRDLKPENIFLTNEGRVKILDFGLAKLAQPQADWDAQGPTVTHATEPGMVMGTAGYMSPEQVRGRTVDHRADIFAFGAILYETLAGKSPFQRSTSADTMAAILNEDPPGISQTVQSMPPGLQRVVYRCLEKNPEQRFQSASDLAFALDALTESSGATAMPRAGIPKLKWLLLALCLGVAATLGLWTRHRLQHAEGPIRSLAVLPLEDLSPGTREDYFADGMTDELITELARIPGLRVVSRTSVMRDKGNHNSLAQIARELNVDAIVEGSVVRSGDRVRITAQLIDARSDKNLWAQTFEGPLGDVLSLQDDVAREISEQTSSVLTPAARAGLSNAKHIDPDAHDAYLRGLYFIQRRDGDLAASYFRKAIALEPNYAAANAGLAEALVTQLVAGEANGDDAKPFAVEAAKRAIELDPDSGEAYTALGAIDVAYLYDWNAAEKNLRKGIELSPSSSDAETWYAVYLTSIGRPAEAVDAMRRSVALDPLSFWANRLLGSMLYYSRRYDESLAALQRSLEIAPDKIGFVAGWNSGNYEQLGRYGDAFAEDMKVMASKLSPAEIASFRSAFETRGWKGYQEARVKYLLSRSMKGCIPNSLAMSYLSLGNVDEAFRWLNRALDNRCGTFDMSSDPRLDKIREDPRFTVLLHRVNLPH
jgi:serine/threonine protein kinase/tetratricopeptide (TPR) repeat protein